MTRGRIEYYPHTGIYTVIDDQFNTVVLHTTSKSTALAWKQRVNQCEHPFPYDILEHDHKVEQWESSVEQSEHTAEKGE
jgi:hypothetical protein